MKAILNFIIGLSFFSASVYGETFEIANDGSVVGFITHTFSTDEETLPDIARNHDLGYYEIKRANPVLDTWLPGEKQKIILPNQFVLPVVPHEGIVVNIPEMRLYYFPESKDGKTRQVITHPIGIGREGWATPYVTTSIIQKKQAPSWYPPESVRDHYAAEGTILPEIVGPGPENPLGNFAMRLGLTSYLIHGTNKPYGVGMRVSSGCIRLYPEDIESLFSMVTIGTKVRIVNQPYKIGLLGDSIYLEANSFLDEDVEQFNGNLTSVVKMLVNFSGNMKYDMDWDLAKKVIQDRTGIPVKIGRILLASIQIAESNLELNNTIAKKDAESRMHDTLELKLETGILYPQ